MSQFFYIHPDNPQQRLINQAVEIVRKGGVIVYPTDSGYALGCKIEDKNAMERICRIRQLPDGHNFTLMSFRWLPDARSIGAPCSRDARRHPGDHRP